MTDLGGGGMAVSNTVSPLVANAAVVKAQVHKVSDSGGLLWSWTSKAAANTSIRAVTSSSLDGGVLAAGATEADTAGTERGWLVRLSASGKEIWATAHGALNTQRFNAVATLPSGIIVAGGEAGKTNDPRWWLARFDSEGNLLADKIASFRSSIAAIAAHHGGRLAVAGTAWSSASATKGRLFGTDSLGNTVWDQAISVAEKERLFGIGVDALGRVAAVGSTTGGGVVVHADPWGRVSCEQSGGCANKLVTKCDDGDLCTRDVCSAKSGCTSAAAPGQRCDDGDSCYIGGTCAAGKCSKSANGRLHARAEDVAGLVSVVSAAPVPGGGLRSFGRTAKGELLRLQTDRYGSLATAPQVLLAKVAQIGGTVLAPGGGTIVAHTNALGQVWVRSLDSDGKVAWQTQVLAAGSVGGCECSNVYCNDKSVAQMGNKVSIGRVVLGPDGKTVLVVATVGAEQSCAAPKYKDHPSSVLVAASCVHAFKVTLDKGVATEVAQRCTGSRKSYSWGTGNPNFVWGGTAHIADAADAVPLGDGGHVVAGHRRKTTLTGKCANPTYACRHVLTGDTEAVVRRHSGDGIMLWSFSGVAEQKSSRLSAVTAASNGGFVAAGTGLDSSDQSRLWLVSLGGSGTKLWQRFLATDVGSFDVRDVSVTTGNDLLLAGTQKTGGINKQWLSRRSREGIELWTKTYTVNGGNVIAARQPLVRFAGGGLSMVGAVTTDGTTRALFVRADPWGAASCAKSGVCASKSEQDCADGKADTFDTCDPAPAANKLAGCVNKALPCTPTKPCESAVTDSKLGCVYQADKCDDSDACTVDSCDPKKGTATGGGCVHTPLDVEKVCADGKVCTLDTCDKAKGCVNAPAPDGLACATSGCHDGTCKQGVCLASLKAEKPGCSATSAAASCAAILTADSDRPDGVYWLDADGKGTKVSPSRALCDMTNDGGGWTLLLKTNGDCTFHYGAKFWTEPALWNENDLSTKNDNAKYAAFNDLPVQAFRWQWPTLGAMTGVQAMANGKPTARSVFSGATVVLTAPSGTRHSSWPPTGKSNVYGFNPNDCSGDIRARWGWVVKSGNYCDAQNRSAMGVGMKCKYGLASGWATTSGVGNQNKGASQPVLIWGR